MSDRQSSRDRLVELWARAQREKDALAAACRQVIVSYHKLDIPAQLHDPTATSNISPISRISNDILSMLFQYHVVNEIQRHSGEENLKTMLDLSHVCSHWRSVAMDNPLCWVMDIELCLSTSVEKLNLYLQRSQQCLLSVHLYLHARTCFPKDTMRIFRSNIHRCRSLFILSYTFSTPPWLRDAHAPFLETMGLNLRVDHSAIENCNEPVFFRRGCPMLSSLQLCGGAAHSPAQNLIAFDPVHITSAELSFSINLSMSRTRYDRLRVILTSMPFLKVLKLVCHGWGGYTETKPVIELDHLQSLYLTVTDLYHGATLDPLFLIKASSLDLLHLSIHYRQNWDEGGLPRSCSFSLPDTVSPHYRRVRQFSLHGNVTECVFHRLAEMCPNIISLRLDLDVARECLEVLTSCSYRHHTGDQQCGVFHWPHLQEMVLGMRDIDLLGLAVTLRERKTKGHPIHKVHIRWPQHHWHHRKPGSEMRCYLEVLSQIPPSTREEILDILVHCTSS